MYRDKDLKFDLINRFRMLKDIYPECEWLKELGEMNKRAVATVELLIPPDYYFKDADLKN